MIVEYYIVPHEDMPDPRINSAFHNPKGFGDMNREKIECRAQVEENNIK